MWRVNFPRIFFLLLINSFSFIHFKSRGKNVLQTKPVFLPLLFFFLSFQTRKRDPLRSSVRPGLGRCKETGTNVCLTHREKKEGKEWWTWTTDRERDRRANWRGLRCCSEILLLPFLFLFRPWFVGKEGEKRGEGRRVLQGGGGRGGNADGRIERRKEEEEEEEESCSVCIARGRSPFSLLLPSLRV